MAFLGKVLLKLSSGNSGVIAIQAKFYSSQVLVNSGENEMAFLDVLLKLNWGTQGKMAFLGLIQGVLRSQGRWY